MTSKKTKAAILAEVISDVAVAERQAEALKELIAYNVEQAERYEHLAKTGLFPWKDHRTGRYEIMYPEARVRYYADAARHRRKVEKLQAEPLYKENEWVALKGGRDLVPVDEMKPVRTDKHGRRWYNLSLRLPYSEMKALDETFEVDRDCRNFALRSMIREACGLPELVKAGDDERA
jgi:hypothetical protein